MVGSGHTFHNFISRNLRKTNDHWKWKIPLFQRKLVLEGPDSTSMSMGGIVALKIPESIWIGQQRLGVWFKAAAYGIFFDGE